MQLEVPTVWTKARTNSIVVSLLLWRPHVRRGGFGCGLRPLIWACDVVTFSDSYGAARGVGCARNCKVRQAQQLCLETRHGSCGRTS